VQGPRRAKYRVAFRHWSWATGTAARVR
jgi:hypothetical protein